MAHFYGWDDDYINGLSFSTFCLYRDAIAIIEAQDTIRMLTVADFPNIKEKSRKEKVFKHFHKIAYPDTHEKVLSGEEAAQRIRMMLNGR